MNVSTLGTAGPPIRVADRRASFTSWSLRLPSKRLRMGLASTRTKPLAAMVPSWKPLAFTQKVESVTDWLTLPSARITASSSGLASQWETSMSSAGTSFTLQ